MKRPEALDTLRELDKQAPHPTYVTADRPEEDPNREVWTLSKNPDDEGWSTDGGYSGYGMTKARATVYAEARNALPDILAYVAHLEQLVQGAAPTGCVLVAVPADVPVENVQAFAHMQRKNADWLDARTKDMRGDRPPDEISHGNFAEARMWRWLAGVADTVVAALKG